MVIISFSHTIMNIFVINEIFLPRKLFYVLIFPYGIYFMEYFFRCNGNFTIHMEKILHTGAGKVFQILVVCGKNALYDKYFH
jgi:hypothetical protein